MMKSNLRYISSSKLTEDRIFINVQDIKFGELVAQGTSGKVLVADWGCQEVAVKVFVELQPELFMQELTMISYRFCFNEAIYIFSVLILF